jgi:hypothetical protein
MNRFYEIAELSISSVEARGAANIMSRFYEMQN